MCFKFAAELQTFKTSDYKNMLQYLMKSCILFDCTVIYLFQGYYLILNCKKVPWNKKKERKKELDENKPLQNAFKRIALHLLIEVV